MDLIKGQILKIGNQKFDPSSEGNVIVFDTIQVQGNSHSLLPAQFSPPIPSALVSKQSENGDYTSYILAIGKQIRVPIVHAMNIRPTFPELHKKKENFYDDDYPHYNTLTIISKEGKELHIRCSTSDTFYGWHKAFCNTFHDLLVNFAFQHLSDGNLSSKRLEYMIKKVIQFIPEQHENFLRAKRLWSIKVDLNEILLRLQQDIKSLSRNDVQLFLKRAQIDTLILYDFQFKQLCDLEHKLLWQYELDLLASNALHSSEYIHHTGLEDSLIVESLIDSDEEKNEDENGHEEGDKELEEVGLQSEEKKKSRKPSLSNSNTPARKSAKQPTQTPTTTRKRVHPSAKTPNALITGEDETMADEISNYELEDSYYDESDDEKEPKIEVIDEGNELNGSESFDNLERENRDANIIFTSPLKRHETPSSQQRKQRSATGTAEKILGSRSLIDGEVEDIPGIILTPPSKALIAKHAVVMVDTASSPINFPVTQSATQTVPIDARDESTMTEDQSLPHTSSLLLSPNQRKALHCLGSASKQATNKTPSSTSPFIFKKLRLPKEEINQIDEILEFLTELSNGGGAARTNKQNDEMINTRTPSSTISSNSTKGTSSTISTKASMRMCSLHENSQEDMVNELEDFVTSNTSAAQTPFQSTPSMTNTSSSGDSSGYSSGRSSMSRDNENESMQQALAFKSTDFISPDTRHDSNQSLPSTSSGSASVLFDEIYRDAAEEAVPTVYSATSPIIYSSSPTTTASVSKFVASNFSMKNTEITSIIYEDSEEDQSSSSKESRRSEASSTSISASEAVHPSSSSVTAEEDDYDSQFPMHSQLGRRIFPSDDTPMKYPVNARDNSSEDSSISITSDTDIGEDAETEATDEHGLLNCSASTVSHLSQSTGSSASSTQLQEREVVEDALLTHTRSARGEESLSPLSLASKQSQTTTTTAGSEDETESHASRSQTVPSETIEVSKLTGVDSISTQKITTSVNNSVFNQSETNTTSDSTLCEVPEEISCFQNLKPFASSAAVLSLETPKPITDSPQTFSLSAKNTTFAVSTPHSPSTPSSSKMIREASIQSEDWERIAPLTSSPYISNFEDILRLTPDGALDADIEDDFDYTQHETSVVKSLDESMKSVDASNTIAEDEEDIAASVTIPIITLPGQSKKEELSQDLEIDTCTSICMTETFLDVETLTPFSSQQKEVMDHQDTSSISSSTMSSPTTSRKHMFEQSFVDDMSTSFLNENENSQTNGQSTWDAVREEVEHPSHSKTISTKDDEKTVKYSETDITFSDLQGLSSPQQQQQVGLGSPKVSSISTASVTGMDVPDVISNSTLPVRKHSALLSPPIGSNSMSTASSTTIRKRPRAHWTMKVYVMFLWLCLFALGRVFYNAHQEMLINGHYEFEYETSFEQPSFIPEISASSTTVFVEDNIPSPEEELLVTEAEELPNFFPNNPTAIPTVSTPTLEIEQKPVQQSIETIGKSSLPTITIQSMRVEIYAQSLTPTGIAESNQPINTRNNALVVSDKQSPKPVVKFSTPVSILKAVSNMTKVFIQRLWNFFFLRKRTAQKISPPSQDSLTAAITDSAVMEDYSVSAHL